MARSGSQAEYSRHRGVKGPTVWWAIEKGQLKESVGHDARGKAYITDFDLADREWEANADRRQHPEYAERQATAVATSGGKPVAAPPTAPAAPTGASTGDDDPDAEPRLHAGMTTSELKAVDSYWKAKQAKLNYLREVGEVGDVAEYQAGWAQTLTEFRAKALGVVTRYQQKCPELTKGQVAALEEVIRELLEALAS